LGKGFIRVEGLAGEPDLGQALAAESGLAAAAR